MTDLILIVEDEEDLANAVSFHLEREGFQTRIASTGAAALRLAFDRPPSLVLLDLMLPDLSGTEVCRRLRADERTAAVPVVMVTARTEEVDRVVGFEVGADDYVVKPFSVRELTLRVRAILRRATPPAQPSKTTVLGCLEFDPLAPRVSVNGTDIELTALELRLLQVLLDRRGRVQTRETLLRDVWDITADINTRTVDTHIRRLRRKLGEASDYVETLRGVGYRFKDRI